MNRSVDPLHEYRSQFETGGKVAANHWAQPSTGNVRLSWQGPLAFHSLLPLRAMACPRVLRQIFRRAQRVVAIVDSIGVGTLAGARQSTFQVEPGIR